MGWHGHLRSGSPPTPSAASCAAAPRGSRHPAAGQPSGAADRVPDGVDGAADLVTELLANRSDVRIDRAGPVLAVVAPHLGEQHLAAEHGAAPGREADEQVELDGAEVHRLAVAGDAA